MAGKQLHIKNWEHWNAEKVKQHLFIKQFYNQNRKPRGVEGLKNIEPAKQQNIFYRRVGQTGKAWKPEHIKQPFRKLWKYKGTGGLSFSDQHQPV